MTTAVLVIHGLESTAPNATAIKLFDLPSYKVYAPQFNHRDFKATKALVDSTVEEILADQTVDDVVVVGSSMGGFWAHYVIKRYNIKGVLVNPALRVERVIRRRGFDPLDQMLYNDLSLTYEIARYKPGTYVDILLGAKDDLIAPEYALENFPSCTVLPDEGHRINNTQEIINMVIEADNNLSC